MAASSKPTLEKTSKIVIVGAGVFGLSTAHHLHRRGYEDITVLERSGVVPAPDAASCDINKGASLCVLCATVGEERERREG